MSLDVIRAAIKTKLESVTGVENVLDYVYWTDDYSVIYNQFVANGRLNTWQIGLASTSDVSIRQGLRSTTWLWNIFGIYSISTSNESSKQFENIVEAVLIEFQKSFSVASSTLSQPATLVALENGIYIQSPIHRCQIQFSVQERVVQNLECSG